MDSILNKETFYFGSIIDLLKFEKYISNELKLKKY